MANRHSFSFTNITPQMDNFNQSGQNGIWGRLENAVLVTTGTQRVSVLAGPVLAADDPVYRGVRVPLLFWKVLVYRPTGQELRGPGVPGHPVSQGSAVASPLDEFASYEVTLVDLAERTGLSFDDTLTAAAAVVDPGSVAALDAQARPVSELTAIHW